jgi:RND family efflux transporter MFP subunit
VRRFLILLVLVCAGCEPAAEIVVEEQAVRPARIFRVSSEGVTVENQFVARVEAAQTVDVSFEVSGPLAELPVREGQTIDKGTLVAALDPTDFQLAVREAEVQLKLARQDLQRKRKLLADRGISQSVVDDAQALHDLRSVRLAQAREALEDARIVAPFDAYVARRYTDNYANVQAGDKIVRLNDLNEIHVVASVPESLAATGSADQLIGAHAVFPFRPDQRYPLTFRENLGEADAVAQTYEVTFAMPPPPNLQILPGMTATLELEMMAAEGEGRTMNIPTSALIADSDKRFIVWIYDPETQAVSKRTVEVGPAVGRGVAVVSGLANGELIVATGASQLQNGMKIRVLGDPLTEL